MSSTDISTTYTMLWNGFLTLATLGNVYTLVSIATKARPSPVSPSKLPLFSWEYLWARRLVLASVYVLACGVRSVWPRHDGDRVCVWDTPLSTPLVGRTLAYVAELCFCAMVCTTLVRCITSPLVHKLAKWSLIANFVAQNACTYAVITRNQKGHVIEESIWMLTAATMVIVVAHTLFTSARPTIISISKSPQAKAFLRGMVMCGTLYVLFMAVVDVPMYVRRAVHDAEVGTQFKSLSKGLYEIAHCNVVTASDQYWVVEMPWMTGYFTLAVWAMLWMAHADIKPAKMVQQ